MFVFVYTAQIYVLVSFTNENGELTILTTKHDLLASYATRKSLLSWQPMTIHCKSENDLFSDQQIWGSSWPVYELHRRSVLLPQFHLPSLSYKTLFPEHRLLVYLLPKARCQNTSNFAEIIHTFFQFLRQIHDCMHALMMKFAPAMGRPNPWTNPSQKMLTDWITIIGFHYRHPHELQKDDFPPTHTHSPTT